MGVSRRTTLFLVIGVAVFFGWKNLSRAAHEVVVLRVSGLDHQDRFASLWVIQDDSFVWIRAENRNRRWLKHLRSNPNVELRRRGQTSHYRATLFDSDEARSYVDSQFRAKYGFADLLRERLMVRDTLPIRLDAR